MLSYIIIDVDVDIEDDNDDKQLIRLFDDEEIVLIEVVAAALFAD